MSKHARLSESAAATLPLLAYLTLAITLIVLDQRGGYGSAVRTQLSVAVEPIRWLARAPGLLFGAADEVLTTRSQLERDNAELRAALHTSTARLHRLAAVAQENQRLRELLGGTRGYRLEAKLVGIADIDLDPFRQRLLLDAGSAEGVRVGQVLVDAGGVMGQVIEVAAHRATALLITDPGHAVPVQVARSGLRAIAYGAGDAARLRLPNLPQSGDIRVGDRLITSGIGGRFPAGFPVAVVTAIEPDETRLFVVAQAEPMARMNRGLEVLLVGEIADESGYGPEAPPPAAPAAAGSDDAPEPASARAEGRP
jgi:rod shape-determining protein MreC